MKLEKSIFKSYDIRGIYPTDLNEEVASSIAQGFLKTLSEGLNKPIKDLNIVIGLDNRQSSEPLIEKVRDTFLEYGVSVCNIGLVSINDFYFACGNYNYDGGMMATASHNPPEYGGFKMVINDLEVDNKISFIPGIDLYKKIIKMELPLKDEKVKGVLIKKDVLDDHFKHIMSFINLSKIKPFKVVVDVGGGMMGEMVNRIFEKLPCELIPMFFEYDNKFSNRAPNPLDDKASDKCGQMILEKKADLGIMFDVDGDRMFLLDEKGQLITGDLTLLLMSKVLLQENPGSGIVYNLICSHAVSELVTAWGGKAIRSEVGYRNLAKHMYEEGGIMSGEVSGHFAFKDNFYADNGPLALVLSLQTVSQDGRELSEIIKEYRLYARGSEINIKVDSISDKLDLIREEYKDNILDEIDGITVEFDTWWFNIRASNTEPLLRITVEAENDTKLKQRQDEVMKVIN